MQWPNDPKGRVAMFASLLLASCASVTPSGNPPWHLLQDCPDPATAVPATNGELVRQRRLLKLSLRECNDDKKALREWYER
jgi:hypothetical protein